MLGALRSDKRMAYKLPLREWLEFDISTMTSPASKWGTVHSKHVKSLSGDFLTLMPPMEKWALREFTEAVSVRPPYYRSIMHWKTLESPCEQAAGGAGELSLEAISASPSIWKAFERERRASKRTILTNFSRRRPVLAFSEPQFRGPGPTWLSWKEMGSWLD